MRVLLVLLLLFAAFFCRVSCVASGEFLKLILSKSRKFLAGAMRAPGDHSQLYIESVQRGIYKHICELRVSSNEQMKFEKC